MDDFNNNTPSGNEQQSNPEIQAETTATTAQTAHTVRARHTAEITAMSITEIQANRRKSRLTISRQSIKKAAL